MSNTASAVKNRKSMAIAPAVVGTIIGLAALYVVLGHLGGRSIPLVSDDRTAFIVLAAIGMLMCGFGIRTILNSTGLLSPGTFVGTTIGVLILIAFVMALLNRPMFLFSDYRTGFIALAIAVLVKWSVSTISLIYGLIAK